MGKRYLLNAYLIFSFLLAGCGPDSGEYLDGPRIEALIRSKTPGIGQDTRIQISEGTDQAPFQLAGVRLFSSAYRFNFDPVPYDNWILDGKSLYPGGHALNIIQKHMIVPGSEAEAKNIAKYILYARGVVNGEGSRVEELSTTVQNGVYEVKLRLTTGIRPRLTPSQSLFILKIGKGVYESREEPIETAEQ